MTKEQRAESRAICEAAKRRYSIVRKDDELWRLLDELVPAALDALDTETKRANRAIEVLLMHDTALLWNEREKWKAKAEALIKCVPTDCKFCAHMKNGKRDAHCTVCTITSDMTRSHWLFDQARFTPDAGKEGGRDEKSLESSST